MAISVRVGPEKIDLERAIEEVQGLRFGAEVVFIGWVRNRNHGRQVCAVEYDFHPHLCQAVLQQIAEEVAGVNSGSIVIQHRIGRIEVGEASIAIAVSTPHRARAYELSRQIIEEIKKRAPIWKKEFYLDGESEWLQGHSLCEQEQSEVH